MAPLLSEELGLAMVRAAGAALAKSPAAAALALRKLAADCSAPAAALAPDIVHAALVRSHYFISLTMGWY